MHAQRDVYIGDFSLLVSQIGYLSCGAEKLSCLTQSATTHLRGAGVVRINIIPFLR